MKIEKINESKLKIIFSSTELEENNISVHSFLSNSIESQRLFLAILDIANEDLGFNTTDSKISYETISFDNKTFVIFITKSNSFANPRHSSKFDDSFLNQFFPTTRDSLISKNSSFNFIGNTLSNLNNSKTNATLLYFFYNIEEVFSFCDFIHNSYSRFDFKNSLYQYENIFFIEINIGSLVEVELKKMLSILSEFKE